MPYCDICHSENCEHQDRSCPCGCGNNPRENCVYDTAQERHVKNMLNLKLDEQWVTDTLEMPCNTCGHSFSRHLTAGGFCKHCECVKFTRPTKRAADWWDSARFTSIFLALSFFLVLKFYLVPPTSG